jgi:hypothetical protein
MFSYPLVYRMLRLLIFLVSATLSASAVGAFDYRCIDPVVETRAIWVDIAVNKIKPFITTPMDAQAEQIFMSYVTMALDQGLDPQTTLNEACIEIERQTAPDKEEALKLRQ